jgi:hypothetical protein
MSLEFPRNQDVFEARQNYFSRTWLGYLEAVARKLRSVEDVSPSVTIDVPAAGAAYSQAYANQQTALINELKAQVNALSTALNK